MPEAGRVLQWWDRCRESLTAWVYGQRSARRDALSAGTVVTVVVVWVVVLWILIGTNWPVQFLADFRDAMREVFGRP